VNSTPQPFRNSPTPSDHGKNSSGGVRQVDRDLLSDAYTNFNARAIDSILAVMHPDVDWPNGLEGGRVRGRQSVREYWIRQWSLIDPHVRPIHFRSDEEGRTTVTIHLIIRSLDGRVLVDEEVEHSYLIEDGLIRRMDFGGQEV
jgi:hypothetical protein